MHGAVLIPIYLIIIIVVLQVTTGTGSSSDIELDPLTFKQDVINDERVWLVDFYSKLCAVCAAFSPTWVKIQNKVLVNLPYYPTTTVV
jgi:hypothetical protein